MEVTWAREGERESFASESGERQCKFLAIAKASNVHSCKAITLSVEGGGGGWGCSGGGSAREIVGLGERAGEGIQ